MPRLTTDLVTDIAWIGPSSCPKYHSPMSFPFLMSTRASECVSSARLTSFPRALSETPSAAGVLLGRSWSAGRLSWARRTTGATTQIRNTAAAVLISTSARATAVPRSTTAGQPPHVVEFSCARSEFTSSRRGLPVHLQDAEPPHRSDARPHLGPAALSLGDLDVAPDQSLGLLGVLAEKLDTEALHALLGKPGHVVRDRVGFGGEDRVPTTDIDDHRVLSPGPRVLQGDLVLLARPPAVQVGRALEAQGRREEPRVRAVLGVEHRQVLMHDELDPRGRDVLEEPIELARREVVGGHDRLEPLLEEDPRRDRVRRVEREVPEQPGPRLTPGEHLELPEPTDEHTVRSQSEHRLEVTLIPRLLDPRRSDDDREAALSRALDGLREADQLHPIERDLAHTGLERALEVRVRPAKRDDDELALVRRDGRAGELRRDTRRDLADGGRPSDLLELLDELAADPVERAHGDATRPLEREIQGGELEGRPAEPTELLLGEGAIERRTVGARDLLLARDGDLVALIVASRDDERLSGTSRHLDRERRATLDAVEGRPQPGRERGVAVAPGDGAARHPRHVERVMLELEPGARSPGREHRGDPSTRPVLVLGIEARSREEDPVPRSRRLDERDEDRVPGAVHSGDLAQPDAAVSRERPVEDRLVVRPGQEPARSAARVDALELEPLLARDEAARAARERAVEDAPVDRGRRRDVLGRLEPPLDLERDDAGRDELGDRLVPREVERRQEILHRPEIALRSVDDEVVGKATRLSALAAVRAPPAPARGREALPGVGDAERPVDEDLELERGPLGNGGDLLGRELAREDRALDAERARDLGARGVGDGHLSGRVDRQARSDRPRELRDPHVLDDDRVGPRLGDRAEHVLRGPELALVDEGVEGDVALHATPMELGHRRRKLLELEVRRPLPRVPPLEAEVDRVGAVLHGGLHGLGGASGGEDLGAARLQRGPDAKAARKQRKDLSLLGGVLLVGRLADPGLEESAGGTRSPRGRLGDVGRVRPAADLGDRARDVAADHVEEAAAHVGPRGDGDVDLVAEDVAARARREVRTVLLTDPARRAEGEVRAGDRAVVVLRELVAVVRLLGRVLVGRHDLPERRDGLVPRRELLGRVLGARVLELEDRHVGLALPEVERLLGLGAERDDRLDVVLGASYEEVVVLVAPVLEGRVVEDRETVAHGPPRVNRVGVSVRHDVAFGEADLVHEALDALAGVAHERAANDGLVGPGVGREDEDLRLAGAGAAAIPDRVEVDPGVVVRVEAELVAREGRYVLGELLRRARIERGEVHVLDGRGRPRLGGRHLGPRDLDRALLDLLAARDRVGARDLGRAHDREREGRLHIGAVRVEHVGARRRRLERARPRLRRRVLPVRALELEDLATQVDLGVPVVDLDLDRAGAVAPLHGRGPLAVEGGRPDLVRVDRLGVVLGSNRGGRGEEEDHGDRRKMVADHAGE